MCGDCRASLPERPTRVLALQVIFALTPNAVELIPTLGALPPPEAGPSWTRSVLALQVVSPSAVERMWHT